jgi:hypothetical protein
MPTLSGFFSAIVTGFGFALGACVLLIVWRALGLPGPF